MEFECSSYVAYFRVLSDGLTICPGCFPAFSPKFWVGLQHLRDPTQDKQFGEQTNGAWNDNINK